MTKQTDTAGQLHLFGQLDIWDCADEDTAPADANPTDAKLEALKNVRRFQTGQRAAATQRKIDARYLELRAAELEQYRNELEPADPFAGIPGARPEHLVNVAPTDSYEQCPACAAAGLEVTHTR